MQREITLAVALATSALIVAVPGTLGVHGDQQRDPAIVSHQPAVGHTPAGDNCTPHRPIVITEREGDQGFVVEDEAGVPVYRPGSGVVAGSGTQFDPFIIEGWCITWATRADPTGDDPLRAGILVEGTSAHVDIQHNRVDADDGFLAWDRGIVVRNAANVDVVENDVRDHPRRGVRVDNSQDVEVKRNHLSNNDPSVLVTDSAGTLLKGNTIEGNPANPARNDEDRGAKITRSPDTTLRKNAFQGAGVVLTGTVPTDHAVSIDTSNTVNGDPIHHVFQEDGATVTAPAGQVIVSDADDVEVHSVSLDGGHVGIHAVQSQGLTIEDVKVRDTYDAVRVEDSPDASVLDATLVENTHDGGRLDGSPRAEIARSTIQSNGHAGAHLEASPEARLTNNTVSENSANSGSTPALEFDESDRPVLDNNTIADNGGDGIDLAFSSDAWIKHNTIHDSKRTGIEAENSPGTEILANNVTANKHGIDLDGGSHAVHDNNIEDNSEAGLSVTFASASAADNWWGAASGPSGGVGDACSSAQADGDGDAIEAILGSVCFTPFSTSPIPSAGAR